MEKRVLASIFMLVLINAVRAGQFRELALETNNELRSLHGISPLKLNPSLNQLALVRAKQWASAGSLPDELLTGDSLNTLKTCDIDVSKAGQEIMTKWYTGNQKHYNHMMFKGNKEVGIAAIKRGPCVYAVAYYSPEDSIQVPGILNMRSQEGPQMPNAEGILTLGEAGTEAKQVGPGKVEMFEKSEKLSLAEPVTEVKAETPQKAAMFEEETETQKPVLTLGDSGTEAKQVGPGKLTMFGQGQEQPFIPGSISEQGPESEEHHFEEGEQQPQQGHEGQFGDQNGKMTLFSEEGEMEHQEPEEQEHNNTDQQSQLTLYNGEEGENPENQKAVTGPGKLTLFSEPGRLVPEGMEEHEHRPVNFGEEQHMKEDVNENDEMPQIEGGKITQEEDQFGFQDANPSNQDITHLVTHQESKESMEEEKEEKEVKQEPEEEEEEKEQEDENPIGLKEQEKENPIGLKEQEDENHVGLKEQEDENPLGLKVHTDTEEASEEQENGHEPTILHVENVSSQTVSMAEAHPDHHINSQTVAEEDYLGQPAVIQHHPLPVIHSDSSGDEDTDEEEEEDEQFEDEVDDEEEEEASHFIFPPSIDQKKKIKNKLSLARTSATILAKAIKAAAVAAKPSPNPVPKPPAMVPAKTAAVAQPSQVPAAVALPVPAAPAPPKNPHPFFTRLPNPKLVAVHPQAVTTRLSTPPMRAAAPAPSPVKPAHIQAPVQPQPAAPSVPAVQPAAPPAPLPPPAAPPVAPSIVKPVLVPPPLPQKAPATTTLQADSPWKPSSSLLSKIKQRMAFRSHSDVSPFFHKNLKSALAEDNQTDIDSKFQDDEDENEDEESHFRFPPNKKSVKKSTAPH